MSLALYSTMSVIGRISDKLVPKWMVPSAHILIVGLILTSAVMALLLDLYNPDGILGCWISFSLR